MGVTGIGGVFLRSRDPKALKAWYLHHLGVGGVGWEPWQQAAGPTAFSIFALDDDYFSTGRQAMLNFRVDDLDGLLGTLRAEGIDVITKPEWDMPEVGRFARIHDPDGNPIELWEPAEPA